MGSVGNQINPWAPYDNYRDCSQEICSIYCPQFCYLIFPPPPPSDQDGSNTPFSPLIIAIIGVLASALVLVSYYTIVTRFCRKRRRDRSGGDNSTGSFEAGPDELAHDHPPHGNNGLDENLIKTITVCKYQRGDGLIEGTECAVCLSEFREDESLRLLPKCSHAFHLPCIDTWLKSQSNCPLCRASVIVLAHLSPENCVNHQVHSSQEAPPMAYYDDGVSSYEVQRPNDLVLVMDDREMNCRRDDVVMSVVEEDSMDLETRDLENARNDRAKCRRSVSFGTLSSQRQLLISDILRIEELDEDLNMGCDESSRGIGSSKGISGLIRSPLAMKRSVSTGRFVFNVNDKGKTSAFQH